MIVKLNQLRCESQYKEFYRSGSLDLAADTVCIHKKRNDLHRSYTKQWIKLLSENVNNQCKN